jgi:hypothetical protein
MQSLTASAVRQSAAGCITPRATHRLSAIEVSSQQLLTM